MRNALLSLLFTCCSVSLFAQYNVYVRLNGAYVRSIDSDDVASDDGDVGRIGDNDNFTWQLNTTVLNNGASVFSNKVALTRDGDIPGDPISYQAPLSELGFARGFRGRNGDSLVLDGYGLTCYQIADLSLNMEVSAWEDDALSFGRDEFDALEDDAFDSQDYSLQLSDYPLDSWTAIDPDGMGFLGTSDFLYGLVLEIYIEELVAPNVDLFRLPYQGGGVPTTDLTFCGGFDTVYYVLEEVEQPYWKNRTFTYEVQYRIDGGDWFSTFAIEGENRRRYRPSFEPGDVDKTLDLRYAYHQYGGPNNTSCFSEYVSIGSATYLAPEVAPPNVEALYNPPACAGGESSLSINYLNGTTPGNNVHTLNYYDDNVGGTVILTGGTVIGNSVFFDVPVPFYGGNLAVFPADGGCGWESNYIGDGDGGTAPEFLGPISASSEAGDCDGSSINAQFQSGANRGTPPYSYELYDPGVGSWATVGSGDVSSFSVSVSPGTNYGVRFRDASGCTTDSVRLNVAGAGGDPAFFNFVTATDGCALASGLGSVEVYGNHPSSSDWEFTLSGFTTAGVAVQRQVAGVQSGPSRFGNFAQVPPGRYAPGIIDLDGGCDFTGDTLVIGTRAGTVIPFTLGANYNCSGGNFAIAPFAETGQGGEVYSINGGPYRQLSFETLAAGDYTVMLLDTSSACGASSQDVSFDPTDFVASIASVSPASCGGTGGSVTFRDVPPYVFNKEWSLDSVTFQADSVFSNLAPGSYRGYLRIDGNCTTGVDFEVPQQSSSLSVVLTLSQNLSCAGDANAEITATTTGNTSAVEYALNGSGFQSDGVFGELAAGTYIVNAREIGSTCSSANTLTIIAPLALEVTVESAVNPTPCGGSDGSVSSAVTGGTLPYTYLWGDGQTTVEAVNLTGGSYSLVVTDANGCTADLSGFLFGEEARTASIASQSDATCGAADGSVTLALDPPSSAATYQLIDAADGIVGPQNSATFTGLAAGTYRGVAADGGSDQLCRDTVQVVIGSAGTSFTIAAELTSALSCFGDADAQITVTPSISGNYEYSLDGGTFQASNVFGELAASASGTSYSFEAREITGSGTGGGCNASTSITVEQPAELTIEPSTTTNPTPCGGSDGSVSSAVSGGTLPYTYLWGDGQTIAQAINLTRGSYSLVVTDANGCTAELSGFLFGEEARTASIAGQSDASCGATDGSVTLALDPPSAAATYQLIDAADGIVGPQNSATFTGLAAGTYRGVAADGGSDQLCRDTVEVVIGSAGTSFTITAEVTVPLSCFGDGDAQITVTPSIAGDYEYALDGGTFQASNVFGELAASASGTSYSFEAREITGSGTGGGTGGGCNATTSITIEQPAELTVVASTTTNPTPCGGSDGSVSSAVTGGTLPYTYLWGDEQTGATATSLSGGQYSLTVTDANGCIATLDGFLFGEPARTASITDQIDASCGAADGSVTISLSPASASATYELVAADGSSSGVQSSGTFTGLAAGTYTATAADGGSDQQCSATVQVVIGSAGTSFTITAEVTSAISCFGDVSAQITVTPSIAGDYEYSLDGGTFQASNVFGGLAASATGGGYAIEAREISSGGAGSVGGCNATTSIIIEQPAELTVEASTTTEPTPCGGSDGSVTSGVSGGTAPYTYLWGNGQTSATATDLSGGPYSLTVTDANGCTATLDGFLFGEPARTASITAQTDASCGEADGSITIALSPSSASATYELVAADGSSMGVQTSGSFTGLAAGTYTATAADGGSDQQCSATVQVVIGSAGTSFMITAEVTSAISCFGDVSAQITVTPSIAGDYEYSLDGGAFQASNVFGGLSASATGGGYAIDARAVGSGGAGSVGGACNATTSITVEQPAELTVEASTTTEPTPCGGSDGSVSSAVTGGTAPYTYLWGDGQTNATATNLSGGPYSLTVTDANGCTATLDGFLLGEPARTASIVEQIDASCGEADGSVTIALSPASASATYELVAADGSSSGVQGSGMFTGLAAGTYTAAAADGGSDQQCIATVQVVIGSAGTSFTITAEVTSALACFGDADAQITVTPSMSGNYEYSLDGGTFQASNVFGGLAASATEGGYVIEAREVGSGGTGSGGGGCNATTSITVEQPAELTVEASTTTEPTPCGGSDGSVSSAVTGGTAPYTYLWGDGQTSATATDLSGGPYSLTVTDANGCTTTLDGFLFGEPARSASITDQIDASCGEADGGVTIALSPASASATFELVAADGTSSGVQSSGTFTGLAAGTYTATASDGGSDQQCSATVQVVIGSAGTSFTITAEVTSAIACFGNADAQITVTASTAGDYEYALDGGTFQASNVFGGLAASATGGGYAIEAREVGSGGSGSGGCNATTSINVEQPAELTVVAATTTDPAPCGGSDGSVSTSVTGGTAPYTYLWGDGQTSATATSLSGGPYLLTVTDANGCTATLDGFLFGEPARTASITAQTDASCGEADGSITIALSPSSASATYELVAADGSSSGVQTSGSFTGLAAGTYTATAADGGSDQQCSATVQVVIGPAGTSFTITAEVTSAISCFGDVSAQITVTPSIAGDYEYSLDGGTFQASNVFGGLAASATGGGYAIEAREISSGGAGSVGGCSATTSIIIEQPAELTVEASTTTEPTPCGGSDGSVTSGVSSGTAPYTYLWGNGQTSATATDLSGGPYSLTVTDANGCTATLDGFLFGEPARTASITEQTDASCGEADGSVTIALSPASASATYELVAADGTSSGVQTSGTFTGLAAGSYTATAADGGSDQQCSATVQVVIGSAGTSFTIAAEVSSVLACFGDADAQITITPSVAGEYEYALDGGAFQVSNVFGELAASATGGGYVIEAREVGSGGAGSGGGGCNATTSIIIEQPAELGITFNSSTYASCGADNGSVTTSATGGTGPYQFAWNTGQTVASILGLAAGDYSVTVTDANLCSTTRNINIAGSAALALQVLAKAESSCASPNGSVTVQATSYNPQTRYSIDGGNAFFSDSTFTDLAPGSYQIIAVNGTSATGCSDTIGVTIEGAAALIVEASVVSEPTCGEANGSALVVATGGESPFTYAWSDGQQTATAVNLKPATTYTVVIKDACGSTQQRTIRTSPSTGLRMRVVSQTDAMIDGTGGSVVLRSNAGSESVVFGQTGLAATPDSSFTGLAAGTYSFYARDTRTDCVDTISVRIGQQIDADFSVVLLESSSIKCAGAATGEITVQVTGSGSYSFSLNDGAAQQASVFERLSAGSYLVTVTQTETGVSQQASITLNEPQPLTISVINIDSAGCDSIQGRIQIAAQGGTPIYFYSWSHSQTISGPTATGLAPGEYTVTAFDVAGCITTETFEVPAGRGLNISLADERICAGQDAVLKPVVRGRGPFGYAWSTGATTDSIVVTSSGTYAVTVTSAFGCQVEASAEVTIDLEAEAPQLSLASVSPETCLGAANGSATVLVDNPGSTELFWNGDPGGLSRANLVAGTYSVTARSAAGCETDFELSVPEDYLRITAADTVTAGCDSSGRIAVAAAGGTGPYAYLWNDSPGEASINSLPAGEYNVVLLDALGCEVDSSFSLSSAEALALNLPDLQACVGSQLQVSAPLLAASAAFYDESGLLLALDSTLILSTAGAYNVAGIDAQGCFVRDTFLLALSEDVLPVNFLVASEAVIGDTVVVIETSAGTPTGISQSWTTTTGASPTLLDSNLNAYRYIFPAAGAYSLTMRSEQGACSSSLTKLITIVSDSTELSQGMPVFTELLGFTLSQNPTPGPFQAEVLLGAASGIQLRLYDQVGNLLANNISPPALEHSVPFDISAQSAGTYFLVLIFGQEVRYLTVLKS